MFNSYAQLCVFKDSFSLIIQSVPKEDRERFVELAVKSLKSNYGKTPTGSKLTRLSKIYVMLNAKTGLYKIGKSDNPIFRERTLQSEDPHIQIIFTSPQTYAYKERKLHQVFETKRVRGEWFNLVDEDIIFIKNFDYEVFSPAPGVGNK